jgi:hypothetical protein
MVLVVEIALVLFWNPVFRAEDVLAFAFEA